MFPRISGGKIWLPYTAETKDGARNCGAYELRPDDPSYPKIKEWLEAVERCECSFFPFRPGDELDQAEVDLFNEHPTRVGNEYVAEQREQRAWSSDHQGEFV